MFWLAFKAGCGCIQPYIHQVNLTELKANEQEMSSSHANANKGSMQTRLEPSENQKANVITTVERALLSQKVINTGFRQKTQKE